MPFLIQNQKLAVHKEKQKAFPLVKLVLLGLCGSVVEGSPGTKRSLVQSPPSHWHMPKLQAQFPVRGMQKAAN